MIKEAMADLVPFEDKTFLFLFVLFSFKIVNQPPLLLFLSRRTALLRAFGALLNNIPISGQTLSPSQGGRLLWLASLLFLSLSLSYGRVSPYLWSSK